MAKIAQRPNPEYVPSPELVKKGEAAATLPQKIKIFFQSIGNAITHRGHSAAYYFEKLGKQLTKAENAQHIHTALNALDIPIKSFTAPSDREVEINEIKEALSFIKDPQNNAVIELKFPDLHDEKLYQLAISNPELILEAKHFSKNVRDIEKKLGIGTLSPTVFKDYTPEDFTKISTLCDELQNSGIAKIVKSHLSPQNISHFLKLPLQDLINLEKQHKINDKNLHALFLDITTKYFKVSSGLNPENINLFLILASAKSLTAFVSYIETNAELLPFIFHFSSRIEAALKVKTPINDILKQLSNVKTYALHLNKEYGYDANAIIKVLQKHLNGLKMDFDKDKVQADCFSTTIREQATSTEERNLADEFCIFVTDREKPPKPEVQKFFVTLFNNLRSLAAMHGSNQVMQAVRLSGMTLNIEEVNKEPDLEMRLAALLNPIARNLGSSSKMIDGTKFTQALLDDPFATLQPILVEYLRHLPGVKETDIPNLSTIKQTVNSLPVLREYLELYRNYIPVAILPILEEIYAQKGQFPLLDSYILRAKDLAKTAPIPSNIIPVIMMVSKTAGSILDGIMANPIARFIINQFDINFKSALSLTKLISKIPNNLLEIIIKNVINSNHDIPREYKPLIKKCVPELVQLMKVALPPIIDGHADIAQKILDFFMNSSKYIDPVGEVFALRSNKAIPDTHKALIEKKMPELMGFAKVLFAPIIKRDKESAQKVLDFIIENRNSPNDAKWKEALESNSDIPTQHKLYIVKNLQAFTAFAKETLAPLINTDEKIGPMLRDFIVNSPEYRPGWIDEAPLRELLPELITEIQNKDIQKLIPGLYAIAANAVSQ